jgi:hypothetical protein
MKLFWYFDYCEVFQRGIFGILFISTLLSTDSSATVSVDHGVEPWTAAKFALADATFALAFAIFLNFASKN